MDAHLADFGTRLSDKLAMLLTADGAAVQDQGWELLRSLPEISLTEVKASMAGLLLAQIRLRAWTRAVGAVECRAFTNRFFALRRFCDLYGLAWSSARLQVDRWPAAPARRGRIRLLGGRYDIGPSWEDDFIGDYAMVSIPNAHPLYQHPALASHFGGLFHDRFLLSSAGTMSLTRQHPAQPATTVV